MKGTLRPNPRAGDRFGKWTAISMAPDVIRPSGQAARRTTCRCDCGRIIDIDLHSLLRGDSHGCKKCTHLKHGHARGGEEKSRVYITWCHIIQRCTNKNDVNFYRYGGRGITVCHRWMKFENFLADMGEKPKGLTIERIDNNLGYSPQNCKWATMREQSRNQRRSHIITLDGKSQCMADWAEETGVKYTTLRQRRRRGWSARRALTQKVGEIKCRK